MFYFKKSGNSILNIVSLPSLFGHFFPKCYGLHWLRMKNLLVVAHSLRSHQWVGGWRDWLSQSKKCLNACLVNLCIFLHLCFVLQTLDSLGICISIFQNLFVKKYPTFQKTLTRREFIGECIIVTIRRQHPFKEQLPMFEHSNIGIQTSAADGRCLNVPMFEWAGQIFSEYLNKE